MTEYCERKGKFWNGCKFEPRFDHYMPSEDLRSKLQIQWALSEKDKQRLMEEMVYVQDVCIRCGKVVARCPN
jgi:hypothetical protein